MNEAPEEDKEKSAIEPGESITTDESPDQPSTDTPPTDIEEADIGSRQRLKNINDFAISDQKESILEALEKSFEDRQDLMNFCYHFSLELYKNIPDNDKFDTIVTKIRQHCDTHNVYDNFWRAFKEKRPNQFDKYNPTRGRYKHKDRKPQRDEFDGSPESTEENVFPNKESQPHPLSDDDDSAILNWFYNDLNEDERSLVLTVGLFQGLNRKYIPSVSDAIKQILFETADDRKGV